MKISPFRTNFLTLILILCSIKTQISNSYYLSGNTLRDLESNDLEKFKEEAIPWTPSGLVNNDNKVTYCYNKLILGGYNILNSAYGWFERTYNGITYSHNMIRFSFFAQPVDSWDAGDTFKLRFNTHQVSGWEFNTYNTVSGSFCGALNYADKRGLNVIVEVPHTGSTLTLTVTSYLNQGTLDESFGFREIKMLFYTLQTPPTTPAMCGIADFTLTSNWCPCPSTRQYMDPVNSGSCSSCHPTCLSCTGNADTDCTSCDPGFYLTSGGKCLPCDSTCFTCFQGDDNGCLSCRKGRFLTLIPSDTSINKCVTSCPLPLIQTVNNITDMCSSPCAINLFAYWDATCSSICKQPLEPLREVTLHNHYKICEFPCQYEEYLYWNGTCGSTCPYPLKSRTKQDRRFCDFTCTDVNKFLYWDAACLDACPFPLSTRIEGNPLKRNFCDYPCLNSQFLYWNGTCMSNCDFPLIPYTYKNKKFCNFTCSNVNQVAYWDGTCQDECDFPKTLISEGSLMVRYYCKFKCDIAEFLYWNGTCSKVCVPPLTYTYKNQRSYCHYPCSSGQYLRWDGVCQSTCPSPLDIRFEAGNHYCDFPCPSTQPYLYWNGSCLASCPYPLQKTAQGSAFFCNFPCNSVNDILYWNGTCTTQCQPPLILNTEGTPPRKFCEYNCQKETQYLYWNGTCSESCNSPLSAEAEAGRKYCRYPCSGSSQYLYWNGSCINQCISPLAMRIDISGKQYCDFPCDFATNEYLYWNGTCSPYCLDPLTRETQGSGNNLRHFCIHGCASITDYLYWNRSCQTFCPYPLISKLEGGRRFCYPPCDSVFQFYDTDTHTCRTDCPDPYTIDTTHSYARCNAPIMIVDTRGWFTRNILTAPSEPGTVTLIILPKMLQYVRYLDIKMPPRLQRLALSQGRSPLSLKIGWSMQQDLQERFVKDTLPTVFARHNMHSSFLVNFWPILTTMAIVIFAAIIFTLLEKVAKTYHHPTWQSIFESLRILTRWSALIIVFGTNIDDFILYSIVQFRAFPYSSWSDYTILSFVICLCVLILVFLPLAAGTLLLAIKAQKHETLATKLKSPTIFSEFLLKWQDLSILFQGFKTKFFITRAFYLLYILRIALPMFVASVLFDHPLVVTLFQAGISLVTFCFIVAMRPIEEKINQIQLVIVELLVFIMNIGFLILVFLNNSDTFDEDGTIFLGDLLIFVNFLLNINVWIFLIFKIMLRVRSITKLLKEKPSKKSGVWLELLTVPLQQAGMGFEEIPTSTRVFKLPSESKKDKPTFTKLKQREEPVKIHLPEDSHIGDNSQRRILNSSSSFQTTFNNISPKSQIIQRHFGGLESDIDQAGFFNPPKTSLAYKFLPSIIKNNKSFLSS